VISISRLRIDVAARVDHEAGGLRPLHGGVRGGLLQPARRPGGAARERDQDRLQLDALQVLRGSLLTCTTDRAARNAATFLQVSEH
jgi:hypothetical protein